MLLGVASYHGLMRRPTFRRLEDSLPLDELLVELNKPEVKAQILSETDLPPDPHRQFESLTDSMPFMFGLMFPLGDPPDYEPTAAQSIAGIAEATGRDPWEVLYDHLATGQLLLGAFTNYAQVSGDPLRGDDRPPRHRDRALRRRRPREDDLRRLRADLPAHPLGPRPHPGRAPVARDGGAQAGRRHRRRGRADRPGHHRGGQEGRPQRDRLRQPHACTRRARWTTCPPVGGGSSRTPPATWPPSSAAWSPAATASTPAPDRAASSAPPTDDPRRRHRACPTGRQSRRSRYTLVSRASNPIRR